MGTKVGVDMDGADVDDKTVGIDVGSFVGCEVPGSPVGNDVPGLLVGDNVGIDDEGD